MKIGFYWKKRNILREETWDFRCCYTDFSTDFSFQAKSISDTSRRPFNASGGVTALLLNNPNNNLENFDKCPVACGYATKVSKVTHSLLAIRSQSPLFKGKCQSRVNTLMHNEISDHLFFTGKQERYAIACRTSRKFHFKLFSFFSFYEFLLCTFRNLKKCCWSINYLIESFEDQVLIRRFIFHNKILILSLNYVRNPKS